MFEHFWKKKFNLEKKMLLGGFATHQKATRVWEFFLRVMVILWRHHPNFRWIFYDNSKNKNRRIFLSFIFILFSTHCIIHKNRIKIERKGGVCISFVGKSSEKSKFEITTQNKFRKFIRLKSKTRNLGGQQQNLGVKYRGSHLKYSSWNQKHIWSENIFEIKVPQMNSVNQ